LLLHPTEHARLIANSSAAVTACSRDPLQDALADARERYAEIIRREPRTSTLATFVGWRNVTWANSKTPSSTFDGPSLSLPRMPMLTTH